MLISEVKRRFWLITWDNPEPADSSKMLAGLTALGRLSSAQTKTTALLAPKASVRPKDIRRVIRKHLNREKGNAVYVNFAAQKSREIGPQTNWKWRSLT